MGLFGNRENCDFARERTRCGFRQCVRRIGNRAVVIAHSISSLLVPLVFLGTVFSTQQGGAGVRSHDCIVRDWKIAPAVVGRRPIAPSRSFGSGTRRIYAYAALHCLDFRGGAAFRFYRGDRRYAEIRVDVQPSDSWRTWASVRAVPGKWRVEFIVSGEVVLEDSFVVGK